MFATLGRFRRLLRAFRKPSASSHRLAWALSSRLNSIIPCTMKVRDDGANVVLLVGEREIGGSAAAAILDDDDDRDFAERARTAVEAVLTSGVRDRSRRRSSPARPANRLAVAHERSHARRRLASSPVGTVEDLTSPCSPGFHVRSRAVSYRPPAYLPALAELAGH